MKHLILVVLMLTGCVGPVERVPVEDSKTDSYVVYTGSGSKPAVSCHRSTWCVVCYESNDDTVVCNWIKIKLK